MRAGWTGRPIRPESESIFQQNQSSTQNKFKSAIEPITLEQLLTILQTYGLKVRASEAEELDGAERACIRPPPVPGPIRQHNYNCSGRLSLLDFMGLINRLSVTGIETPSGVTDGEGDDGGVIRTEKMDWVVPNEINQAWHIFSADGHSISPEHLMRVLTQRSTAREEGFPERDIQRFFDANQISMSRPLTVEEFIRICLPSDQLLTAI